MKKAIRVLSMGSLIIYALSCAALLTVTLFQTPLVRLFYGYYRTHHFTVAFSQLFSAAAMLALSVIAFVAGVKDKRNVLLNILLVAIPVAVVTPVSWALSSVQTVLESQIRGTEYVISMSYVKNLASLCTGLNFLAYGAYMVCGGLRIGCLCEKKRSGIE